MGKSSDCEPINCGLNGRPRKEMEGGHALLVEWEEGQFLGERRDGVLEKGKTPLRLLSLLPVPVPVPVLFDFWRKEYTLL